MVLTQWNKWLTDRIPLKYFPKDTAGAVTVYWLPQRWR